MSAIIKTANTETGINRIEFESSFNPYFWFHNLGNNVVYVSVNPELTVGGDGVSALIGGGITCLETTNNEIYILGSGTVEIHRTDSKLCPFKNAPVSTGGGGSEVDAYSKNESDARYAQKSDIPTSLPADGGNADTAENIKGVIIFSSLNIGNAEINSAVKRVCNANTIPKTTGFVYAGIWFKNTLDTAVTAAVMTYATEKSPVIQTGYGIGSFQSMFGSGSGREWFSNITLDTAASAVKLTVPAGKTGYFGFNRTSADVYAVIDDITVFTDRFI